MQRSKRSSTRLWVSRIESAAMGASRDFHETLVPYASPPPPVLVTEEEGLAEN